MTQEEIKMELLENFMYSAFDKPSEAASELTEDKPELEIQIDKAFDAMCKAEMFSSFQKRVHGLIRIIVKEEPRC